MFTKKSYTKTIYELYEVKCFLRLTTNLRNHRNSCAVNQTYKLCYPRFLVALYYSFISKISRFNIFDTKETGYFSVCLSLSSLFDKKKICLLSFFSIKVSLRGELLKENKIKKTQKTCLVVD